MSAAEEMPFLSSNSVDLVTCAQAIHWFDREKFYTEVKRVLNKNGVLAVIGYGLQVTDDMEINEIIGNVSGLEMH